MFPLKDNILSLKKPYVTYIIIAANTIIYLFQFIIPRQIEELFIFRYGLVPAIFSKALLEHRLTIREVYPFLTSMFLHGNWLHIISNMWVLWIFGDNIEDRLGHFKYTLFYFLSGLSAMLCHYIFSPSSTIPAIGASGAVAGVMGAYFILFPHSRILTFIPVIFIPALIHIPAVVYLLLWFLMQLYNGALGSIIGGGRSGTAWWAHVGGFLSGILLLKLFYTRKYKRPVYYD